MKKLSAVLVQSLLCLTQVWAKLEVFSNAPNGWEKSKIYSVKVKEGNGTFKNSYTHGYAKTSGNLNRDWCEIRNDKYWTNLNFDSSDSKAILEVTLKTKL
ncbi:hypothetical protein ACWGOQ_0000010 [Aquimarina sp. M1]